MRGVHTWIVGLTALALAGCGGMELQKAERLTPGGSEFEKGLYAGYIELARLEYGEGDYTDADVFALRAAGAAGGNASAPENIAERNLPHSKKSGLSVARARLVAMLEAGARSKAPTRAATAQVMFDCWMQEQEENFQPAHIDRCREVFFGAMTEIDAMMEVKPVAAKPLPPLAPSKVNRRFVVYFLFDSAEITDQSTRVILSAIDTAKQIGAKRVYVTGHADRSGSGAYNNKLSDIRANAVVTRLTGGGVSLRVISVSPLGELVPAVETSDGARQAQNRRVEINISN